ncbi:hydrogenase formation protein HypD [Trichlorobacter ammonificans]|uniref:Hydrogenase maturation factor HypD n=1 Tax=Trichlorobacter ammonificans TaxID=2916410 RepID=A0ABM9D4D6_9BACT|nr:hydrogenase formation protein HypD [Trichlorobacter ammonificans]CAH2030115.1 Hydrogenase maturation factor HypD [Trichlorobacter ammonificans]
MKHQDEYRDHDLVQGLAGAITREASTLVEPVRFMEVCGTHTMAIARFGLKSLLPPQVRLVSGPGCPVCVTPVGYIDHALALATDPGTIITTFGDLLRVPGSRSSLLRERARGADVRIVYSPLEAVRLAAEHPGRRIVFLGIGFETTAPTVAASVLTARSHGLTNYFVLASHKTMPAPMAALSADPRVQIRGYLCPAHVSTVIGGNGYRHLVENYRIPCVVTGFEPADIMQGILWLLRQHLAGTARVEIQYARAVTRGGNPKAQALLRDVFAPCDALWRGLGVLPASGLAFRDEYAAFDAARMLPAELAEPLEPAGCRCGEVLTGRIEPTDCPLFGTACTPEQPVGACMVSSEGSCAAAWRYRP